MSMIRIYVHDPLDAGREIQPDPDQARYLTSVMRLGVGDEVALFNGRDGEWLARLSQVSKRGCVLTLEACLKPQANGPDLDLVIALIKRAPLETIIEKATELGVRRIRLVTTRRTNAGHTNLTRLQAIATEAAEQCGRLDVPEVVSPQALSDVLASWDNRGLVFCDEAGEARPGLTALRDQAKGSWAVLIGPEGGFDPIERQALRAMKPVVPISLGTRILRADTAAICALFLWQSVLGDGADTEMS
jgi:16S rRNA (uracil1498-N3)-methyltransferase